MNKCKNCKCKPKDTIPFWMYVTIMTPVYVSIFTFCFYLGHWIAK